MIKSYKQDKIKITQREDLNKTLAVWFFAMIKRVNKARVKKPILTLPRRQLSLKASHTHTILKKEIIKKQS